MNLLKQDLFLSERGLDLSLHTFLRGDVLVLPEMEEIQVTHYQGHVVSTQGHAFKLQFLTKIRISVCSDRLNAVCEWF